MNRRTAIAVLLGAVGCVHAPTAPTRPDGTFRVFSLDDQGGGWVLHHRGADGDTLWGCADTRSLASCTQVFSDAWHVGARLDFLHVSAESQRAWLRMRTAGYADSLLACVDPEGKPTCRPVQLPLQPRTARLERVWPAYRALDGQGAPLDPWDPRRVVEPSTVSTMWLEAGPPAVGAMNLYACTGLDTEAVCQVGALDANLALREDLGLRRFEDADPDAVGTGARLVRVEEGSAAWEAGLREGMVVVAFHGFDAPDARALRDLSAQVPAGMPVEVVTDDGRSHRLVPRLGTVERRRRAR